MTGRGRAGAAAVLLLLALVAGCSDENGARSDAGGDPVRLDASVPQPDATPASDAGSPARPDGGGDSGTQRGDADAGSRPTVPPLVLRSWTEPDGMVKRGLAWREYRKGLKALRSNDLESATVLLQEAVTIDGSYELAYGALAVIAMRTKSYEECIRVSAYAVQLIHDRERLGANYYNLGKCLEHAGRDEAAFDAYRTSLEARDNDIVSKALGGLARKLGRRKTPIIKRAVREELVKQAATAFLKQSPACKTRVAATDDRPGVYTCGSLTTWGAAGSFSEPDAEEVLLALSDTTMSRAKRRGYGVLLRRVDGSWQERARTPLLAPGEGGVDFLGTLPDADGTNRAVVQVSDCHEGCCTGFVRTIAFEADGEALAVRSRKLFPVGIDRSDSDSPSRQALVTGARKLDEDGDGRPGLLLRFEARLGKANPHVYYLRVNLAGAKARLTGQAPSAALIPRCE